MFDPTLFNFVVCASSSSYDDGDRVWMTLPVRGEIIGSYIIDYYKSINWYRIIEISSHNNKDRESTIYYGKIPDNEFAYQLFINMELNLPCIRRELRINSIVGYSK